MGQNESKEEIPPELCVRMNSARAFKASWLKKEGSMKHWKEENENGAIYNVYLKKVRYRHSVPSVVEKATPEQNSGLEWEMVKVKTIKAAPLEKLVEHLPVALQEMDSSYINIFFCTYQTFTNQLEVLRILLDRFKNHQIGSLSKEHTQKNIRSVILMWLDENLDDFREPPDYPCLSLLQEFAKEVFDLELGERARRRMDFFKEEAKEREMSSQLAFHASMCDEVDGVMMDNTFMDIKNVNSVLLAQQLTRMDADLFRKVNLQHCLGGMWSRRGKKTFHDVASVKATVTQFNDVSNRVMTTVVEDKTLRPHDRAAIIKKWIEVAQVCREMKNFSSAKAIISGLQTHPVFRLKKVWHAVPRAHVLLFEDLGSIFMDDNNFEMSRELLMKEGTAKFACVDSPRISRKPILNLVRRLSNEKSTGNRREHTRMHGTVPYLGTFLTDLIKIDVANPDTIGDGLINFEKKRKEFEVIAQIKLLQNAAKNYRIPPQSDFVDWFTNMNVMTYEECCDLSDEIAGPTNSPLPVFSTPDRKGSAFKRFFSYTAEDTTKSHRSSSSLSSTSSTGSAGSADTPLLDDGMSFSSENSPATSLNGGENPRLRRVEMRKTTAGVKEKEKLVRKISASYSMTDLTQLIVPEKHKTPDTFHSSSCRIIRISLEGSECNVYKSIVITQQEHTPSVIRTAAEKHNLPPEENLSEFMLVQNLPMGELPIPDNANVYYAMNANVEPDFMLKRRPPPGAVIKRNISKSRRTRKSWIHDSLDS